MSQYRIGVTQGGIKTELRGSGEQSFLALLRDAGFTGIHAPCGGNGTCHQCGIQIFGPVRALAGGDVFAAAGETLLSCGHVPAGDCDIIVPEARKMEVVTSGADDIAPCGTGLGLAVDIGTTTVAVYLYELSSGRKLAVDSDRNAQRPFGADVISRIQFCSGEGGLSRLSDAVRRQIERLAQSCCRRAGRSAGEIVRISIAGNTVMEHIFAGLSPVSIGVAPFKTLSLFGDCRPAAGIFSGFAPEAEVYLTPALAGYVGGDITAGIWSSGACDSTEPCLFIDIGTNGEMGIGGRGGFICCATAAGPAFEGAEIECGMDGSAGAISAVRYENGAISFDVIGGGRACGICGSGLIDALCAMLRCGAVQENGRMSRPDEVPPEIAHMLRADENGRMRFYLTDDVYVSGDDVRQLQMAKGSIRAGIETLLCTRGCGYADIGRVIIAGGFGAYMDVRSACAIGLLPPAFLGRTRHAGNTAGRGAALALDTEARRQLADVAGKCSYLELSSSALFMEKYIECMVFDEAGEVF